MEETLDDWHPDQLVDDYVQQRESLASANVQPLKHKSVDEVLAEMSRVPLFMNSQDEVAQHDNEQLEALKALAYEGTPTEIAENFKSQGNELVRAKRWFDAREFYSKALEALHTSPNPCDTTLSTISSDEDRDPEIEMRLQATLRETCHANRALCNLEMKNYAACQRDCNAALRLNSRNTKVWYRAATAYLALDKIEAALDACRAGIDVDPTHTALGILRSRIEQRRGDLHKLTVARESRQRQQNDENLILRRALMTRNISVRQSTKGDSPVDVEDAAMALDDPGDMSSTLRFPVLFLYPMEAQSDFVKAVSEFDTIGGHLDYVLPPPWDDTSGAYAVTNLVECYMETIEKGLVKVGKNLSLLKLLSSGKVGIIDGIVKINIVPKSQVQAFVKEFKRRKGST